MTEDGIKARLAAATPGPWFARPNDLIGGWCVRTADTPPSEGPGEVADFIREEDARFIAHAPEDLAALIEEVRYLRGERAAVVAWLREQRDDTYDPPVPFYDMLVAANAIERGEHHREEEK